MVEDIFVAACGRARMHGVHIGAVGYEDVHPAVAVYVGAGGASSGAEVGVAAECCGGDVRECAVAVVAHEAIADCLAQHVILDGVLEVLAVADDALCTEVDVLVAVVVHIAGYDAGAVGCVGGCSCFHADFGECSAAVIAEE